LEVAGDVRRLFVEHAALQQFFQPGAGLAALARLFLAALLGLQALLLLLLRAQCPGLAQVHLAGRLAPRGVTTPGLGLALARPLAGTLALGLAVHLALPLALPLALALALAVRLRARLAAAVLARLRALGRRGLEA